MLSWKRSTLLLQIIQLLQLPCTDCQESIFGPHLNDKLNNGEMRDPRDWDLESLNPEFPVDQSKSRVKRQGPTVVEAGMVKLQNQNSQKLCMRISDKSTSANDIPIVVGECTEDNTWKFVLAGRWDAIGLIFELLYHFEFVSNELSPLTSETLSILEDKNTKAMTVGFYYRVYSKESTWVWRAGTIRGQPFEIRPTSTLQDHCLGTSQDKKVYLKPCGLLGTFIWRLSEGRFMDNFGNCLGRTTYGHAMMDACSGNTTARRINLRPLYFIQSSQVAGKCVHLLLTGTYGLKNSGNLTTGDCFFSWNYYWAKLDDRFNPDAYSLINPVSEQTATSSNAFTQIYTYGYYGAYDQQWIGIPVAGMCKADGAACEGAFGGCCSGQCAHTCRQLCKYSGDACTPKDTCCSAVQYCSHKPACETRNPLTCHKKGEQCWDCCGGRKCAGDRTCVCSDVKERCVDDDDCCDDQAVCTNGICTPKMGAVISTKCGSKFILGETCTQDSDCCDSDGVSIKCQSGKCTKVCYWNDLEYCTNDNQCCPGRQCSQDQKCVTGTISGRPSPLECKLGMALCKTDYECCDNKCILARDGRHSCSGPTCNSLGNTCNVAGVMDARGKDCCRGGLACRNNKCVSCQNEGSSCGSDTDCCPGTEPRVFFKCEATKCKKYWSKPTCLSAGEESSQANCHSCCNGYNSCTVEDCGKGFFDDNCYFCNPGAGGAQCKTHGDCKSGKCDLTTYYCFAQ